MEIALSDKHAKARAILEHSNTQGLFPLQADSNFLVLVS